MWAERSSLWHLNLSHSKPVIVRLNYCLALIDVRGKKAQTVVRVLFGGEGLLWRTLGLASDSRLDVFSWLTLTGRLGADIWAELQQDSPRERLHAQLQRARSQTVARVDKQFICKNNGTTRTYRHMETAASDTQSVHILSRSLSLSRSLNIYINN